MATKKRLIRNKKTKHLRKTQHKKPKLIVYGKIYANWCGHCRAMENDWNQVEKKMLPLRCVNIESEEKDHKIAEFNRKYRTNLALQNGFPTIFRLKKVGGSIEYYEGGDRSEAALSTWLKGKKPAVPSFLYQRTL
jgi:thiol-disulfide isomerase/thioredoxin